MKHFLEITTQADSLKHLRSLDERSLVIYSPTSAKLIGVNTEANNFIDAHSVGKDAATIERLFKQKDISKFVALGGGTAIDIAKYAAYILNCEFICIPTMLSTNAFATNKVALMKEGRKVTLDAKLPDSIILDPVVVDKAGILNLYGLCDILSIHTALFDWMIADRASKEKIDSKIFMASEQLLEKAIRLSSKIAYQNDKDIMGLFALIGESGHITNIYGSGRPESGSEHIFAKELERRIDIPHGISIASGITLMSQLQDNYSNEVQNALQQMGILNKISIHGGLRRTVEEALLGLVPRKDRYTILNETTIDLGQIKFLTDNLFKTTQKATHEYSTH